MRTRVPAIAILALVVVAGCVPDPAARAPADQGAAATPIVRPTPAGPTPTPSFVRPTPTPQPTFFVYTVHRGDTLSRIARLYGTDGRSIAYWNRVAHPSLDPDSGSYKPDYVAVGWQLQLIPGTVVDPENLPPGAATPAPAVTAQPEESDVPIEG
ncbi:MAG: LysM peptidoglycan-binding domain-containing protein [Chloroflexota bacterium]